MAKILVVDDSPITRAMISDFPLMTGHQIADEAEGMAQTLAAYAAHRPDADAPKIVGNKVLQLDRVKYELWGLHLPCARPRKGFFSSLLAHQWS